VRELVSIAAFTVVLATVSGCGGGHTYELTAPATTTVLAPRSGSVVRCTNHGTTAQAKLPPRGSGTGVDADGADSSASLQVTRKPSGALVIVCSL
jgi:hypothetical protein